MNILRRLLARLDHQSCWRRVQQAAGEPTRAMYLSGETFTCQHGVVFCVIEGLRADGGYSCETYYDWGRIGRKRSSVAPVLRGGQA